MIGLPLTRRRVYNLTIMTRSRTIEIVEVGPRDGLQNEPGNLPLPVKREFIERIVGAGFKRIEVAKLEFPILRTNILPSGGWIDRRARLARTADFAIA